ncbi:MAG: hypothetical protein IKS44_06785 [Bacteroidales bacterium]|nr:hypothetical protein [Bacteroidales bacterium]
MNILPKRPLKVADRLWVLVSNYYMPTTFGIRGRYASTYRSGTYVETGTPGTGFYARTTSSHQYSYYLKRQNRNLAPNYLRLLTGTQFSFSHEIARATVALRMSDDPVRVQILESYMNVLNLAKEVERCERIIRAIKDKSHFHRHHLTKYQTSVLTSYKSRVASLAHDVRQVQLYVPNFCSKEEYEAFRDVTVAFSHAAGSHRIWSAGNYGMFKLVFFDMGIFNYIQSDYMTPVMRDEAGVSYYLFPRFVIRARRATDFDVVPLSGLTFTYREVPYDKVSSMLDHGTTRRHHRHHSVHADYDSFGSGLFVDDQGGAVHELSAEENVHVRILGELTIPELNLRFYTQGHAEMRKFVETVSEYKKAHVG